MSHIGDFEYEVRVEPIWPVVDEPVEDPATEPASVPEPETVPVGA